MMLIDRESLRIDRLYSAIGFLQFPYDIAHMDMGISRKSATCAKAGGEGYSREL